jgi:uncharacterized protein YcbK (DUF882 family)
MRGKTSSIALIASLALSASAAAARPAHRPMRSERIVASSSRRTVAPEIRHTREASITKPHLQTAHERPSLAATRRQTPVPAAEPDVAETLPEPEVHVHHDRKVHLSAGAPDLTSRSAEQAPAAPLASARRVATAADFMVPPPPADPSPVDAVAAAERHPVQLTITGTAAPSIRLRKPKTILVKAPEEKLASAPPLPEIPIVQPVLFTRSGRLIVPPALKGSHEILVHQNTMADEEGLERIQDDADLERMRAQKLLVAFPVVAGLQADERLAGNRRYCRPWTATFLQALARAHYARFHSALQVNSAVRTVEFQERLRYTNGNAAPAEGATASPHLTGQAVDIAKHGLSLTEIAWLRAYLLPLVQEGKVDVEEEFQQACFHISVYKKYVPQSVPKREIPGRHSGATALAAAMQ